MMTLDVLRGRLRQCDDSSEPGAWPAAALGLLGAADCWRRTVPLPGGAAPDPRTLLETYEAVAWGSLTSALILTQHVAAAELLADGDNAALAQRLLPPCAGGSCLASVGISQLTTSRRFGRCALRAERRPDGFRLNGIMPWVTSAARAAIIVAGGELDDGTQLLAVVGSTARGLHIDPPLPLLALQASWTAQVRCDDVRITPDCLLRGPAPDVLRRRSPVKSLTVSVVGLGVAAAILHDLHGGVQDQPEFADLYCRTIEPRYQAVRARVWAAARTLGDPDADIPGSDIRAAVNDLLARLAPSLMIVAKGSGYVGGHRAQRLLREAAFFQVWSAPLPVRLESLRRVWRVQDDSAD